MRVTGVIAEYNPFHNGHQYHLAQARKLSGADYVIAVMSGGITQRGVFARYDKFLRARLALLGGADLVLELPARFACAAAPDFAYGGVRLLEQLGVVTHLSFGCEPEASEKLEEAAKILSREEPSYISELHQKLETGLSWPAARMAALTKITGEDWSWLGLPNAVLALEYLMHLPAEILPVPVKRRGAGYDSLELSPMASASGIRRALETGNREGALFALPCPELIVNAEKEGRFHIPDSLDAALLYCIRRLDRKQLAGILDMDEGLENRFAEAAVLSGSRETLIARVKSRRYTWTRLSRICAHAMLGLTRDFAEKNREPIYARILGFRKEAQPLLHAISEASRIPLIAKCADYDRHQPLLAMDLLAHDLWALGCAAPEHRRAGQDFTTSPVVTF